MKEDLMNFDYSLPLYVNGNGGKGDNILFRSLITGPVAGVGTIVPGFMKSSKEQVSRIFAINCSRLKLYKIAFEEPEDYPDNRIILQVKKPAVLRYPANVDSIDDWKTSNTFCYELIVPSTTVTLIKEQMIADLCRCFGYKAFYENRLMDCLVLTADTALLHSYTKTSAAMDNLGEDAAQEKYIYHQPVDALVSYLNSKSSYYIINETGCTANLDVHFPGNAADTPALINALKGQGLYLTAGNPLPIVKDYRQGYTDTAGAGNLLDWKYRPLDELNLADNTVKQNDIRLNIGLQYRLNAHISVDVKYQYELFGSVMLPVYFTLFIISMLLLCLHFFLNRCNVIYFSAKALIH